MKKIFLNVNNKYVGAIWCDKIIVGNTAERVFFPEHRDIYISDQGNQGFIFNAALWLEKGLSIIVE